MKQDILIDKKFTVKILKQFRMIKRFIKKSKAQNINELFREIDARGFCFYFLSNKAFFYLEYQNIIVDIYACGPNQKFVNNDIQVFDDEGQRLEWHYYIK